MDHLDDIASDFSVFHRITDASGMSARRFAALAQRLPAYGGAVAAALARDGDGDGEAEQAPPGFERVQFEGGGGESFESRMARAVPLSGAAGEATITRLMTAGA